MEKIEDRARRNVFYGNYNVDKQSKEYAMFKKYVKPYDKENLKGKNEKIQLYFVDGNTANFIKKVWGEIKINEIEIDENYFTDYKQELIKFICAYINSLRKIVKGKELTLDRDAYKCFILLLEQTLKNITDCTFNKISEIFGVLTKNDVELNKVDF